MLTAEIFGPDLIIVIVVGVIVLLFGGSKLPKLARGLGSASHEFKKGLDEGAGEGKESSIPGPTASAVTIPVQPEPVHVIQPVAEPVPPVQPAQPVQKDASAT